MSEKIRVNSVKPINGKGALKAFASITIANKWIINSIRIVQQDGQAAWVSLPQNEIKAADGGKPKYFPVVEIIDDLLKKEVIDAVLHEYNGGKMPEGW